MKQRGQVGIEYMIIIAFVTFVVLVLLTFAVFYSSQVSDSIRLNQVENFAVQTISAAEAVFYSGEPSKSTLSLGLPDGVSDITIRSDGLLITVQTQSGENIRLFESDVPLSGTIVPSEGVKRVTLIATDTEVVIS